MPESRKSRRASKAELERSVGDRKARREAEGPSAKVRNPSSVHNRRSAAIDRGLSARNLGSIRRD